MMRATLLALLLLVAAPLLLADPLDEHQVKAAFLYNFTKFVEWPADRLGGADPIVIGVYGRNRVCDELHDVVRERKVNGHDVLVKEVREIADAKSVHALYIGADEDDRVREVLPSIRGAGVLTVGETARFAQQGGMIVFVREGDKLRFQINAESAEQSGLKIGSQLLRLARPARE
jgi:hypothetical protein